MEKVLHKHIQHLSHVQWSFLISSLLLLCPQALPTNPKALLRATPENRERERERERVRNSLRNGQRWTNTSTTRRKATRKKFNKKNRAHASMYRCKYCSLCVSDLRIFCSHVVTVLLVCPGWPPDVSVLSTWLVVCWCHVLPCRLSVPSHLVT